MPTTTPNGARPLTLQRLDELSAVALVNAETGTRQQYAAAGLSAYLEWYWLRHSGHDFGSLIKTGAFGEFDERLRSRVEVWMTTRVPARGFLRVRRQRGDIENPNWMRFRFGLQKSARAAGFSSVWANQIVGAIGELEDNVHCHSQAPTSAILAYWFLRSELEIVVLGYWGAGLTTDIGRVSPLDRSRYCHSASHPERDEPIRR